MVEALYELYGLYGLHGVLPLKQGTEIFVVICYGAVPACAAEK